MDYSEMTFERILQRCLERVPSAVDKREGSIIYDALAPAAVELAILYTELSTILDRANIDTATGLDLDNKARERGIFRAAATPAIRKGTFTGSSGAMDIPIGSRFTGGSINYVVTQRIAAGSYQMTCEEAGEIGNSYFGNLLPVEYVADLATATLEDILIPGEDEESDDELRKRYYDSLTATAFGGNKKDYREKVNALVGVGDCRVYPAWNGGGTVRVAIIASDYNAPSELLVSTVQTALDPVQNQGEGVGIAPIGHVVTVEGVTSQAINVSFKLTLENNVVWGDISKAVEEAIAAYLASLRLTWADASPLVVRTSRIDVAVLDVAGVVDISNTTINGKADNITLGADVVPILGAVTNVN